MCGISGVVCSNDVTKSTVASMIDRIGYRGPDEQGSHALTNAVIGHARLAVVDPENGHQPMSNEDGTVWVSFNGEIYNFIELRDELKLKGHTFKSRCDTEVLVHLWEEEGERMLDRLIGMFAFLLWDDKKQRGILARDRQGIKPCYYARYKGGIAFGSEIKAILDLPDFPRTVHAPSLSQVFSMNYPVPPETCFEGVRHLMPGTFMLFEKGRDPVIKTYWKWPLLEERRTASFEEFESLLDDAIRLQMRFDVDGGIFLSGGVDSSVIASRLVRQWNRPVLDGIALDFNVEGFSELKYSEYVAKQLGINLKPFSVTSSFIPEIAEKVVYHSDEPHGDFSYFLFYLLCEEAHKQGKIVMFLGDGPDEALLGFGNNERYFSGVGRMNFSLRTYYDLICYMNQEMRERFLTPEFLAAAGDPYQTFRSVIEPWEELDPIEQVSAYELTALLPGNNAIKSDRMGAGWAIEGRSPLLDHRISELFARLPTAEKFKDGIGKSYLKRYAARTFEHDFIFRPKTMPTMPIGEWVKSSLYEWTRKIFAEPDYGIFKNSAILQMLDDHREEKRNYTQQIRTIIMAKLWLRQFFS